MNTLVLELTSLNSVCIGIIAMQRDDSAPRVGGRSRRCVYICICNYGRSWNTSGNGSDGWVGENGNCDESKEEVEGRRRKEEEKESTTPRRSTRPCAHCGRQVPLYRSTECNLPRNLCTGMRQTSRNKRFILAHAVVARIQHTLF